MVPPPSLIPPFQTAHAFLIMIAPQVVAPPARAVGIDQLAMNYCSRDL
jgi:hypothetical protein